MKKFLLVLLILVAGVIFFYMRENSPIQDTTFIITTDGLSHPDPSNATFVFDDDTVTLTNGRSLKQIAGSTLTEDTAITNVIGYGDINADSKEDAILILAQYGAGSGTFIYLAGFVSGPITYRGSETFFLGDRIAPKLVSVKDGVITVEYLDREPDEPYSAEPTVRTTRQFVYSADGFREWK